MSLNKTCHVGKSSAGGLLFPNYGGIKSKNNSIKQFEGFHVADDQAENHAEAWSSKQHKQQQDHWWIVLSLKRDRQAAQVSNLVGVLHAHKDQVAEHHWPQTSTRSIDAGNRAHNSESKKANPPKHHESIAHAKSANFFFNLAGGEHVAEEGEQEVHKIHVDELASQELPNEKVVYYELWHTCHNRQKWRVKHRTDLRQDRKREDEAAPERDRSPTVLALVSDSAL